MLLRYAEEYNREWLAQIELEEFAEAQCWLEGREWRPDVDDQEYERADALVTRKLRNDTLLKLLDNLPKTGRPAGGSGALARCRALAQTCLDKAHGNEGVAKRSFIRRMKAENNVGDSRATVLWYKVTERVEGIRRVG
jgi:hypothetical protein